VSLATSHPIQWRFTHAEMSAFSPYSGNVALQNGLLGERGSGGGAQGALYASGAVWRAGYKAGAAETGAGC